MTLANPQCYCTLDEYLDGHRCRCPNHTPCGECEMEERPAMNNIYSTADETLTAQTLRDAIASIEDMAYWPAHVADALKKVLAAAKEWVVEVEVEE